MLGSWNDSRMERSVPVALSAALLLLILATPASAEHCESGIAVFGRPAFSPGVLPPTLPRYCVTLETSGSAGHVLPPGTQDIFVRVEADLGASYPILNLKLDGLGFHEQTFHLTRTQSAAMWTYNVEDWLPLPEPTPGDSVTASVRFPGNYEASAQYTLVGVRTR